MEAEKIKKKLNGSILRGSKMRVEEARPEKKVQKSKMTDTQILDRADEIQVKVAKKRRREDDTLSGYELPGKRKVKRGWTEPAIALKEHKSDKSGKGKERSEEKKKRNKAAQTSSFTDGPECLFRAKIPHGTDGVAGTTSGQVKNKKKQFGKSDVNVVVHEFSNTTKSAAFLRDSQATDGNNAVSEYVEGRGWINGDGAVVEQEARSRRKELFGEKARGINGDPSTSDAKHSESSISLKRQKSNTLSQPNAPSDLDDTSSSAISSSSDEESGSESDDEAVITPKNNCSSESSSPASTTSSADMSKDAKTGSDSDGGNQTGSSPRRQHDARVPSLDVTLPPITAKVHPLEALFKRPKQASSTTPKKPNLEVKTSFSFFNADAEDQDIVHPTIPQTPFTQRDFQQRRMRSAAPTPDTAAPSKMGFGRVWSDGDGDGDGNDDDDNEEDAFVSTPLAKKDSAKVDEEAEPVESEFSKWFWEHRGETNRAWKKRRREAGKEKRQQDNKRRERSVV